MMAGEASLAPTTVISGRRRGRKCCVPVVQRAHGHFAHPQLLHNRPCRPRQEHPRRTACWKLTQTVSARDMQEQLLDSMQLERERGGHPSRASAVRMNYQAQDGREYTVNLIDTPRACRLHLRGQPRAASLRRRGAGCRRPARASKRKPCPMSTLALDQDLEIIPVINKIDLPRRAAERNSRRMCKDLLGTPVADMPLISAKNGIGVHEVLEKVIAEVPAAAMRPRGAAARAGFRLAL